MNDVRFTCEQCGSEDYKVIETRQQVDWRRRRIACRSCDHRVTTYEVSERQFLIFQAALKSQVNTLQIAESLRNIADELDPTPALSNHDGTNSVENYALASSRP
jgi:hypothetical protein